MNKHLKGRLLCLLLALIMVLSGCRNPGKTDGNGEGENTQPGGGFLSVYVEERYRITMQQLFSATKMDKEVFSIHWVGDLASADVVITDYLPEEQLSAYRVLELEKLDVQSVSELLLRDERGVIGIPLFLRVEGFWYDAQYYGNDGVVPQSLDSWIEEYEREMVPAVFDGSDATSLFWAVVAPLYLHAGGTAEQLSQGVFQKEPLEIALERLETISSAGLVQGSGESRQVFTTAQTPFWITDNQEIAASYNYKTTVSSWNLSTSLPFYAGEQATCVIRADVVAVKESADVAMADRFVEILFEHNTLEDLSASNQMPIACRLDYSSDVLPEIVQICYTALSAPSVKLSYVHCRWSASQYEKMHEILLAVAQGTLTVPEAVNQITNP